MASQQAHTSVPPELQLIIRTALDQALREYNAMMQEQKNAVDKQYTKPGVETRNVEDNTSLAMPAIMDLPKSGEALTDKEKPSKKRNRHEGKPNPNTRKVNKKPKVSSDPPKQICIYSPLSQEEKRLRKRMENLKSFLNMEANEHIKSVFEFIADWGFNSAAGTVFLFPGPSCKDVQSMNTIKHSAYFTVGIHVGLMRIILDTFINYFEDSDYFQVVRRNVDKFVRSVRENPGHFLFKEHAETVKTKFPPNLRDRFHLPIECHDFKSGDIVYFRINTFWSVLIALNKKSEPAMLEMEKLVDLAKMAQKTHGIIHVDHTLGKGEAQLNLFEPLSLEQKTLLKKKYEVIFRRIAGQAKRVLAPNLMKKSVGYAEFINAGSNNWRLRDKTNKDEKKHWCSDEPVLCRNELTRLIGQAQERVKEDEETERGDEEESSEWDLDEHYHVYSSNVQ